MIYEHVGSEEADYLVRTLQSEGCLKYLITERQQDGKFVARVIENPGPTGFITTTTRPALHDENETRLWSLTVDESDGPTAAIIDSIANRFNSRAADRDLMQWVAAQEWLGLPGAGEAVIRFSHWLADRMPKRPVRMRRDFGRLLALVETSGRALPSAARSCR